jgi:hypothetical protein
MEEESSLLARKRKCPSRKEFQYLEPWRNEEDERLGGAGSSERRRRRSYGAHATEG